MKKKTAKKRIFISNTLMICVALVLMVLVTLDVIICVAVLIGVCAFFTWDLLRHIKKPLDAHHCLCDWYTFGCWHADD